MIQQKISITNYGGRTRTTRRKVFSENLDKIIALDEGKTLAPLCFFDGKYDRTLMRF